MKDTFRYFLKLSYNGANYNGWQLQKNAPSVQAEINQALVTIFKEAINVVGCGRTDTGVHAVKFYAHFDVKQEILLSDRVNILTKLNGCLPKDIAISELLAVNPDAHARFDAISRTYEYRICRVKDPFYTDSAYYFYGELDVALMNKGATILKEYTDFTSFSKVKTDVKTYNCKITHAVWKESPNLLVFQITADRFLRNMVRAIVGTLLDLGRHKISEDDLRHIILSKNRSNAGYSVPAKGLYLTDIVYPDRIFDQP